MTKPPNPPPPSPFPATQTIPAVIQHIWVSDLVTEDLDLRVGPVQRLVAAVVVAVRVYLDHQRETLDALLRREVRTQAVDRDEDLTDGTLAVSQTFVTDVCHIHRVSREEETGSRDGFFLLPLCACCSFKSLHRSDDTVRKRTFNAWRAFRRV